MYFVKFGKLGQYLCQSVMIVLLRVFYFACVKLSDTSDPVLLVNYCGRFTLGLGQNDIDKVLFFFLEKEKDKNKRLIQTI